MPLAALVWGGVIWGSLGPSLGFSRQEAGLWAAVGGGVLCVSPFLVRLGTKALRDGRARRTSLGLWFAAVAAAAAWAAGYAVGAAHLTQDTAGPVGELLTEGGATNAVLEITADPRPQRASGAGSSGKRYVVEARLLEATRAGLRFSASVRVILTGGEALARATAGDIVEAPARVRPASAGGKPFVVLAGAPRSVGHSEAAAFPAQAREALRRHAASLPADAAGLVPALATGDRSGLDLQLEEDMRAAGLAHLSAVSGANFAIVLGSVAVALRLARCPRWGVVSASGLTLVAFVAVVGPEPSVLRAAGMGSIALLAVAAGRGGAACSALCAAVVALLLADPSLALSLGFLLSVLATVGIALLSPRLAEALSTYLPRWISLAIAVPLSAQLLCGPALVFVRPELQAWSLAANILAAPVVPFLTVFSTLALATGLVAPALASAAIAVAAPPALLLAAIAHTVAGLPGAGIPWPEGPLGAAAMGFTSVFTACAVLGAADPRVRRGAGQLARAVRGVATGRGPLPADG